MVFSNELLNKIICVTSNASIACYPHVGKIVKILADKSATFLLSIVMLFFFILLGSGLIIELSFFPPSVNYILSIFPISMTVQAMQSYLFSGFINWPLTFSPLLFSIGLLIINSILLRNKLRQ